MFQVRIWVAGNVPGHGCESQGLPLANLFETQADAMDYAEKLHHHTDGCLIWEGQVWFDVIPQGGIDPVWDSRDLLL
jgi:hypothetical protein